MLKLLIVFEWRTTAGRLLFLKDFTSKVHNFVDTSQELLFLLSYSVYSLVLSHIRIRGIIPQFLSDVIPKLE